jgi:hypothetical protein
VWRQRQTASGMAYHSDSEARVISVRDHLNAGMQEFQGNGHEQTEAAGSLEIQRGRFCGAMVGKVGAHSVAYDGRQSLTASTVTEFGTTESTMPQIAARG